jgi:hypothetical protein
VPEMGRNFKLLYNVRFRRHRFFRSCHC